MSTIGFAVEPVYSTTDGDDDDDLCHVFCSCNENIALCGADLSGDETVDEFDADDLPCVVCTEMESSPCPRCGEML